MENTFPLLIWTNWELKDLSLVSGPRRNAKCPKWASRTNRSFCPDKTLMPQVDKESALSVNQNCGALELI